MATNNSKKSIGLIMIGLPGMGKSATGNTILGRKEFFSKGGGSSVTKNLFIDYRRFDGDILKVVDTPGFNDTDVADKKIAAKNFSEAFTRALIKYPQGFKAVLYVVSYGQRMTNDTVNANKALVALLKEQCLKENGILVITYGDSYKYDYEDDIASDIKTWIQNEDNKTYKWLLEICSNRCVLFDNRTRNEKEKEEQMRILLDEIKTIENTRFLPNDMCKSSNKQIDETFTKMEAIGFEIGMMKLDVYDLKENKSDLNLCQTKVRELLYHANEMKKGFELSGKISDNLSNFITELKSWENLDNLETDQIDKILYYLKEMQTGVDEAENIEINTKGTFWNKFKKGLYKVLTSDVTWITVGGVICTGTVIGVVTVCVVSGGTAAPGAAVAAEQIFQFLTPLMLLI